MMGYGMWGGGWITMLIMWFIPILLIGVVVYAVVKLANGNNKNHENKDALSILNERFAKGEIDEEEYKRKKEVLKQ